MEQEMQQQMKLTYVCGMCALALAFQGCSSRSSPSNYIDGTVVSRTNSKNGTVATHVLLKNGAFFSMNHKVEGGLLSLLVRGRYGDSLTMFTNHGGTLRSLNDFERKVLFEEEKKWRDVFGSWSESSH